MASTRWPLFPTLPSEIRSTVHARPDRPGKWRARVWVPGQASPIARTFNTEVDARDWVDQTKAAILRGSSEGHIGIKARMTVGEFAATYWWPYHQGRTEAAQRGHWKRYVEPKWGKTALGAITVEAVLDWIGELKATPTRTGARTPISASYVGRIYYSFTPIIALAQQKGFITYLPLPTRAGKALPILPQSSPVWLREAEVEVFADTAGRLADERGGPFRYRVAVPDFGFAIYTAVKTMAYAGLRVGELLALRVGDLRLAEARITVDEQLTSEGTFIPFPKNGAGSARLVPVGHELIDLLVEHLERNRVPDDPGALVFQSKVGGYLPQSSFRSYHNAARVAVPGKRIVTHTLRHTAANAWWEEGFKVPEIALFMGDSEAVVTRTYLHMSDERDDRHNRMDARNRRAMAEAATLAPSGG